MKTVVRVYYSPIHTTPKARYACLMREQSNEKESICYCRQKACNQECGIPDILSLESAIQLGLIWG